MVVAVVTYHRIADPVRFHDLRAPDFAAHLDLLAGLAVAADGPLIRLAGGRAVLPVFDDATDDHARAADMLEARGLRGLFLIPCGRLGEPGRLSWRAIADLARRGHGVGAHGVAHRRFDRMCPAELRRELRDCRDALEALTGRPVEWLAPPGGHAPPDLAALAAGYGFAAVRTMRWGYAAEPLAGLVPTLPVNRATTPARLLRLIDGRAPLLLGRAKSALRALAGERLYEAVRDAWGRAA